MTAEHIFCSSAHERHAPSRRAGTSCKASSLPIVSSQARCLRVNYVKQLVLQGRKINVGLTCKVRNAGFSGGLPWLYGRVGSVGACVQLLMPLSAFQGTLLQVCITRSDVMYTHGGTGLAFQHHPDPIPISTYGSVTLAIRCPCHVCSRHVRQQSCCVTFPFYTALSTVMHTRGAGWMHAAEASALYRKANVLNPRRLDSSDVSAPAKS